MAVSKKKLKELFRSAHDQVDSILHVGTQNYQENRALAHSIIRLTQFPELFSYSRIAVLLSESQHDEFTANELRNLINIVERTNKPKLREALKARLQSYFAEPAYAGVISEINQILNYVSSPNEYSFSNIIGVLARSYNSASVAAFLNKYRRISSVINEFSKPTNA